MKNIQEQLDSIRLEYNLLESHCIQTEAGLEAIDPKVFLQHLRKMTFKSTNLLKTIMENSFVSISFVGKNELRLSNKVMKTPFLNIGANEVNVPIAFVGSLSEFTKVLFSHRKEMQQTLKALIDANAMFSNYIMEPKELVKADPRSVPSLPKKNEVTKDIAEFFKGKEGSDRARLEDVYLSYNDFDLVSEVIENLTKELKDIKLNDVKSKSDDLYSTIDRLTNMLDRGEMEISKPVAKALGQLVLSLADWLAIFSLYITKTHASTVAHTANVKKLNKLA